MVGPRNYPLALAAGVAVMLFSLVGAAAITGVLPISSVKWGDQPAQLQNTAAAAAASKAGCRNCGVVAAVKSVEVRGDTPRAGAVYRVTVRMDDGSERILSQSTSPFHVGARVRVNGHIIERG
jgi:hypothetical protein